MAKAKKKPVAKKPTKKPAAKATKKPPAGPVLFRLNVEVRDLDRAETIYNALLDTTGRRQAGSRIYYSCGGVTIQMVDVSGHGDAFPHPVPKALYFLVDDLDGVHARAKKLGVLSMDEVHGQVGGEIAVRPWGERSFYVDDPWQNTLCFVQTGTTYPG